MNDKNSQKQVDSEFVCKLCDMMQKFPEIINWDQSGEKVIVSNIREIEVVVLPQYFRHSNFASFIRQLNMYDFHKIEKDEETNEPLIAFEHSIFKRGNERNFHFIQRKKKNKEHENTLLQFNKKYEHLIDKINTEAKFTENTKKSINKLIEFKFIASENTKKIKSEIENVYKELKDCRSKKISNAIKEMNERLTEEMSEQILLSKNIDKYLECLFPVEKENQQNLANQYSSLYYSSILSKDTFSIPEMGFDYRVLHPKPNLLILPSQYTFFNHMSGHDLSNTHSLFFSNPQYYSEINNENKHLPQSSNLKSEEESEDESISMVVVDDDELKNLLSEKKEGIEKEEVLKKEYL